ncbi:hypothetical protein NIES4071_17030 [Calothrix sp. NIES-4071]|nr:hypothetical protein NIES4071_17030 [Calothrix sp. NIES-4071]BAZ56036.1 hypothetical protein NIES4105_16980 [Calothrix sp. NIES-4105]
MSIIRQYIAPLIAIIIFFIALAATSARIFLPSDMLAPAPVDGVGFNTDKLDAQNGTLVSIKAPLLIGSK